MCEICDEIKDNNIVLDIKCAALDRAMQVADNKNLSQIIHIAERFEAFMMAELKQFNADVVDITRTR